MFGLFLYVIPTFQMAFCFENTPSDVGGYEVSFGKHADSIFADKSSD